MWCSDSPYLCRLTIYKTVDDLVEGDAYSETSVIFDYMFCYMSISTITSFYLFVLFALYHLAEGTKIRGITVNSLLHLLLTNQFFTQSSWGKACQGITKTEF